MCVCFLSACTPEERALAKTAAHETEIAIDAVDKDLGAQGAASQAVPSSSGRNGPNAPPPYFKSVPVTKEARDDADHARHDRITLTCSCGQKPKRHQYSKGV